MAPSSSSDLALLMAAIAAGHRDAFSILYDHIAPGVMGIAMRTVRDWALAEEIAHDALVEVWQKADQYRPERGSVMAWIGTITRRRAIDVVRSVEARRRREEKDGVLQPRQSANSPEDELIRSEEQHTVQSALGALTPLEREAVELTFYGGLTYRQAAEKLGVPLGTMKTRMRAALARLGGQLTDEHV